MQPLYLRDESSPAWKGVGTEVDPSAVIEMVVLDMYLCTFVRLQVSQHHYHHQHSRPPAPPLPLYHEDNYLPCQPLASCVGNRRVVVEMYLSAIVRPEVLPHHNHHRRPPPLSS